MPRVTFGNPGYRPIDVLAHTPLPVALEGRRSPLRFGCEAGICATCVVSVEAQGGTLAPPSSAEADVLSIFGDGDPTARLACQLDVTCDVRITRR